MSKDLKKKKSDYLLELALEEQLDQDMEMKKYEKIEETEPAHVFSKEHDKRMQEIFKMADKVENKSRKRKRSRQIAAGFALFFCISAFSITQVEAFRLPVVRFFMEIKEKSTLFEASKEMNSGITQNYKQYEPHYVPAGFAVLEVHENEGGFYIKYLNDQKQQAYDYYFFEDTDNTAVDTENGNTIEIKINGNQAYLVQKGDEVNILMNKNNKQFYLNGTIPYEEAIKVMESIK
ncbi:hypothetical protein ADH76_00995 [Enterocloster clostridioformis]|nr:hypothetical protein A4V08_03405 [Lachnoclostridium sp. YL32]NDO27617.1 DUF4367 domain-containing protein [Enterocloster clostridioformis]OXE70076.1 hypothetical protein ADH76_00995 [Enterocloster clostridioformis]QQR00219.1 DUF4367 domain-containing protein [Enterocloster clostridioformis]